MLSFTVESAYVGNLQGPPVTIERRRATEEGLVRKEVRSTAALVADPAKVVRATATLGAGALEGVAVATFGAALVRAVLCAAPFFFFFVVVVGVPDKSKPDSSIAAMQFHKRRIICNAMTGLPRG
jgi:hypothetical protein